MRTDDKIVKLARSAKRSGIKLPFNVIADALDQDHRYMGVRIGSTYKRLIKRGQAREAKDVADNICRADGRLAWPKMVMLIFLVQVVVGCSNRARIEGMLGERLGESLTANVQHKAEIARFTGTCDMVIVPENPFPGFMPGENELPGENGCCRYNARIDRHKKVCLLSFYGEWEKDPKCDRDRVRKSVANKIRLDITNKYGNPDETVHFKVGARSGTTDRYCKDGRYLWVSISEIEMEGGDRESISIGYSTEDGLMAGWIEYLLRQQKLMGKIEEEDWQRVKDSIPFDVFKKIQHIISDADQFDL